MFQCLAKQFCALLLSVLTGAAFAAQDDQPIDVVASFSILADMVKQVGGSDVRVYSLVGPDSDSHVFNPTPNDAKALAKADLVVINGLGFEGWMKRLVQASGFKGPVVVASAGVETLEQEEDHHGHDHGKDHDKHDHDDGHEGKVDPHAWQDLRNARIYVANIRDALVKLRPENRDMIEQRAQSYIQEMEMLDAKLRSEFSSIPAERRKAIVSHDAFGYLAHAYDIDLIPVQGWTTGREASAADIAKLIRLIRDGKVHAYFVENMSDPRVLQRIASESGALPGGKLYSDALSAPGTEADTYLKMYEVNARRILDALNK